METISSIADRERAQSTQHEASIQASALELGNKAKQHYENHDPREGIFKSITEPAAAPKEIQASTEFLTTKVHKEVAQNLKSKSGQQVTTTSSRRISDYHTQRKSYKAKAQPPTFPSRLPQTQQRQLMNLSKSSINLYKQSYPDGQNSAKGPTAFKLKWPTQANSTLIENSEVCLNPVTDKNSDFPKFDLLQNGEEVDQPINLTVVPGQNPTEQITVDEYNFDTSSAKMADDSTAFEHAVSTEQMSYVLALSEAPSNQLTSKNKQKMRPFTMMASIDRREPRAHASALINSKRSSGRNLISNKLGQVGPPISLTKDQIALRQMISEMPLSQDLIQKFKRAVQKEQATAKTYENLTEFEQQSTANQNSSCVKTPKTQMSEVFKQAAGYLSSAGENETHRKASRIYKTTKRAATSNLRSRRAKPITDSNDKTFLTSAKDKELKPFSQSNTNIIIQPGPKGKHITCTSERFGDEDSDTDLKSRPKTTSQLKSQSQAAGLQVEKRRKTGNTLFKQSPKRLHTGRASSENPLKRNRTLDPTKRASAAKNRRAFISKNPNAGPQRLYYQNLLKKESSPEQSQPSGLPDLGFKRPKFVKPFAHSAITARQLQQKFRQQFFKHKHFETSDIRNKWHLNQPLSINKQMVPYNDDLGQAVLPADIVDPKTVMSQQLSAERFAGKDIPFQDSSVSNSRSHSDSPRSRTIHHDLGSSGQSLDDLDLNTERKIIAAGGRYDTLELKHRFQIPPKELEEVEKNQIFGPQYETLPPGLDESRDNSMMQEYAGFDFISSKSKFVRSFHRPALTSRQEKRDCEKSMIDQNQKKYILPKKIKFQEEIGNSNLQKLELLKPKWVINCEMSKVLDENGRLVPPQIVIGNTLHLFTTQLPLLIASFKYLDRTGFVMTKESRKYEYYMNPFVDEFVYSTEKGVYWRRIKAIRSKAKQQTENELNFRGLRYLTNNFNSLKVSDTRPIGFLRYDEKVRAQIREIEGIIYNSENDTKGCWFFERPEVQNQAASNIIFRKGKFDYRWVDNVIDRQGVFYKPINQGVIIPLYKQIEIEMQFMVVYQFAQNFARWARQTVKQRKIMQQELVFEKDDPMDEERVYELSKIQFFPLKQIHQARNSENREEIYHAAARKIAIIAEQAEELGIMYSELENVVRNTDYAALKKINDIYDIVDGYGMDIVETYPTFRKHFDKFLESLITEKEEHNKFVLQDTNIAFKHKLVPTEYRYSRYCAKFMSSDKEFESKYHRYTAEVYEDWPPTPSHDEVLEEQKRIAANRVSKNWKRGQFWSGLSTIDSMTTALYELKSDWIFGGSNQDPKALYQLNRNDWKLAGKMKIKHLYQRAQNAVLQSARSKSSKSQHRQTNVMLPPMTRKTHEELVYGYKLQFAHSDLDMESDLFALSFYKTEYETRSHQELKQLPRMEIIRVYNTQTEKHLAHWLKKKFYQEAVTDRYFEQYAIVKARIDENRRLEQERAELLETEEKEKKQKHKKSLRSSYEKMIQEQAELQAITAELTPKKRAESFAQAVEEKWPETSSIIRDDLLDLQYAHINFSRRYSWEGPKSTKLFDSIDYEQAPLTQRKQQKQKKHKPRHSISYMEFHKGPTADLVNPIKASNESKVTPAGNELYEIKEESSKVEVTEPEQSESQTHTSEDLARGQTNMLSVFSSGDEELFTKAQQPLPIKIPAAVKDFKKKGMKDFTRPSMITYSEYLDLTGKFEKVNGSYHASENEDSEEDSRSHSSDSSEESKERKKIQYRRLENPACPFFPKENDVDEFLFDKKGMPKDGYDFSTMLAHPKQDNLNRWMEQGAENVSYQLNDFTKLINKQKHFEETDSVVSDLDRNTDPMSPKSIEQSQSQATTFGRINSENFKMGDIPNIYNLNVRDSREMSKFLNQNQQATVLTSQEDMKGQPYSNLDKSFNQTKASNATDNRKDRTKLDHFSVQSLYENTHNNAQQDELQTYFESQLLKNYFKAIKNKDVQLTESYLVRFKIPVDIQDNLGNTGLNIAAQAGDYAMIHKLIEMGANAYIKNSVGRSASDYAFEFFENKMSSLEIQSQNEMTPVTEAGQLSSKPNRKHSPKVSSQFARHNAKLQSSTHKKRFTISRMKSLMNSRTPQLGEAGAHRRNRTNRHTIKIFSGDLEHLVVGEDVIGLEASQVQLRTEVPTAEKSPIEIRQSKDFVSKLAKEAEEDEDQDASSLTQKDKF